MVTSDVALRLGSAWLVACTETGFCEGAAEGARYTTPPGIADTGGVQGFELVAQICPTVVFPFAIPFTVQTTFTSLEPVTVGVIARVCEGAIVTLDGDSTTDTSLITVIAALAVSFAAVA
jgi:hypothetical protein